MARLVKPLTATQVQNAKPKESIYKLFDGGGLFLQVTPAGGKHWKLSIAEMTARKACCPLGRTLMSPWSRPGKSEMRLVRRKRRALTLPKPSAVKSWSGRTGPRIPLKLSPLSGWKFTDHRWQKNLCKATSAYWSCMLFRCWAKCL